MLFTVFYQDGRTYTSILEFRTYMETAAGAVSIIAFAFDKDRVFV